MRNGDVSVLAQRLRVPTPVPVPRAPATPSLSHAWGWMRALARCRVSSLSAAVLRGRGRVEGAGARCTHFFWRLRMSWMGVSLSEELDPSGAVQAQCLKPNLLKAVKHCSQALMFLNHAEKNLK